MARGRSRSPIRSLTTSRRRFLGRSIAIAAAVPLVPGLIRPARADGEVSVYNWDTYIGETTLQDFTDATGTSVRYDLFGGNDELFAKLREGNPGYDVIFPSNDYIERMIAADMLESLDHAKIPNMTNLEDTFLEAKFDPGRAHSLTYFWGTFGIGYRSSAMEAPTSWRFMLDPEQAAGRKSLLNDITIVQLTLKALGFSPNSKDPAEIRQAVEALIRAKPGVQSFAPDTGQDLLISGEVDACVEYNGDILQVMEEDDDLSYAVPEEGTLIWEDAMAIPVGAPNRDNAHAFINYILDPEVHASIAEYIRYACPNRAAKALLPEEDLNNPAMYPPEEVVARSETTIYQGEEVMDLYARGLTEVLAA